MFVGIAILINFLMKFVRNPNYFFLAAASLEKKKDEYKKISATSQLYRMCIFRIRWTQEYFKRWRDTKKMCKARCVVSASGCIITTVQVNSAAASVHGPVISLHCGGLDNGDSVPHRLHLVCLFVTFRLSPGTCVVGVLSLHVSKCPGCMLLAAKWPTGLLQTYADKKVYVTKAPMCVTNVETMTWL